MAFYALWILGFALCILAVVFLYKNVVALKDTIDSQRQFRKVHEGSVLATFDQGWMWFDIILGFVALSFSTQASTFAKEGEFAPEILCFIGIAIFCAGKAVSRWNNGRMVFYKQGVFYKNEDIPFTNIKHMEPYGGQFELAGKKAKYMVSRRQADEIKKRRDAWKESRQSKHKK